MQRTFAVTVIAAALLASACSAAGATDNVGTFDGSAGRACSDAGALAEAISAGGTSPTDVRARAQQIYDEAMASSNPVLQAKAVALFTDATLLASGGNGVHVGADVRAITGFCPAAGG